MSEQLPRSYVSRSRYTYIFLLIYTLIIMHPFMQNHWLGDHTILTLHITTFSAIVQTCNLAFLQQCKCATEQSYIIETVQSLPLKSVQISAEYFCIIAFVFVLLYFVFVSSSFTSLKQCSNSAAQISANQR